MFTIRDWTEYSRFFAALPAILDPFLAITILLALTKYYSDAERNRINPVTALTVAAGLIVVGLTGEILLHWLGTSLGSFRVAGEIVLFLKALAILRAQSDSVRETPSEEERAASQAGIAVIPPAIPLLAGPGAMSTAIVALHRSSAPYHHWK